MPKIVWDQSYSVGVVELDEHHKKLISMINELHFAMKGDRGQKVVCGIVSDMLSYARMHFEIEEKYMRQSKYLGVLQHLKEHAVFTKKAEQLEQRCQSGEFVVSVEVVWFLSDWLKTHILEADQKYVSVLQEKGFR